jgi:tRNA nucleotidyltransferase (CCA-adding enzyme)
MAQTYLVGGAVRDKLLGRESKDNDYVVVGSTSQEMLDQGFQQVGADFPVFLHPVTGDEYALARQERKNGKGYHGFAVSADPSITIEEDLLRRDLTINAMAMTENDQLIDPYGGYKDLQAGVLRHTSEAFGDDPLRVLRLARFTARYTEFYVAEETISLCKTMIARGDLVDLSKERIVAELFKGFGEKDPERMMLFLWDCDAQFHAPLNEYFGDGAFAAVSLLAGR